jgi:hypothetical protein
MRGRSSSFTSLKLNYSLAFLKALPIAVHKIYFKKVPLPKTKKPPRKLKNPSRGFVKINFG